MEEGSTIADGTAAAPGPQERRRAVERASNLAIATSPFDPRTSNEQLREYFQSHPGVSAVAVVDGNRPLGLVTRKVFMESYARPFARDLWGRKSCQAFMNRETLAVDAELSIVQLARLASDGSSRALEDGFIVTREGRYLGLGSGPALVRALSDIEAAKAHEIQQSITYASLIQRAMLSASAENLRAALPEHSLIWQPRDVVGGDCCWFRKTPGGLQGAVLDCTGHGVPGAFMTFVALSSLEQAYPHEETDPGRVLARMNRALKSKLQQDSPHCLEDLETAPASDDGLDGVCFFLSRGGRDLRVASAHFPVLVQDADVPAPIIVEGERASLGYAETNPDQAWVTRKIALSSGSTVVMASDGYTDQIGGPRRTALGRGRLSAIVSAFRGGSAARLGTSARAEFERWKAEEPQRDDVTVLAFTVR